MNWTIVTMLSILLCCLVVSIEASWTMRRPMTKSKLDMNNKDSYSIKQSTRNIFHSVIASAMIISTPYISNAVDNSKQLAAYSKLQQVESSIKYIQEDIEKGGDPAVIIKEVQILLNNYKLRENVVDSLSLIPSKDRNNAEVLGKEAYEDLQQIIEYYPDSVDNVSGKKTPPLEVLTFAQQATASAESKLKSMLRLFPDEAVTISQ